MSTAARDPSLNQPNVRVVEMLVCPLTKTQLIWSKERNELVSRAAGVAFPITKGVPLLCLEEARTLTQREMELLESGKSL